MGKIAQVQYDGELRCRATHLRSGDEITTDAPIDNNGKGEAFSPTDLLATSLASCILTVMGIKARSLGFDLEDASAEVVKEMESNPRRIGTVAVKISLRQNCDEATKEILERVGQNCPVAQSLHPDLIQSISFEWK